MNEIALEERISRLQKEFRMVCGNADQELLDLRVEVDRLKLEVAALKYFLGLVYPSFAEQYPQIFEKTIREFNPEED